MKPPAGVVERPPERGPQQEQLDAFEGQWRMEGENLAAASDGAGETVSGDQSFHWMSGSFFMVHLWSHRFHSGHHEGIACLGYDGRRGEYEWQAFDSLGYARRYDVAIGVNAMLLSGPHERAEIILDGDRMTTTWERSTDGRHWEPLCRLRGTRIA